MANRYNAVRMKYPRIFGFLAAFSLALSATLPPNASAAPLPEDSTPQQLNIAGFASCLADQERSAGLEALGERYHFGLFDLLLPYLAIYPGTVLPAPLTPIQRESEQYWQTPSGGQVKARHWRRRFSYLLLETLRRPFDSR